MLESALELLCGEPMLVGCLALVRQIHGSLNVDIGLSSI